MNSSLSGGANCSRNDGREEGVHFAAGGGSTTEAGSRSRSPILMRSCCVGPRAASETTSNKNNLFLAPCGDVSAIGSSLSTAIVAGVAVQEQEASWASLTLRHLKRLLSLASPSAAEASGLEAALLELEPDLRGLLPQETRALALPRGSALHKFVSFARQAVGEKSRFPQVGNEKNLQLLLLPHHIQEFAKKMDALKAAGKPYLPKVAFHSTPYAEAAHCIARGNFDPNQCGRHDQGYYGRGTYFHTKVPHGGRGGENTFFALILTGQEFSLTYSLGCSLQPGYDSHVAADRLRTGETVIFSQDQMLPVFRFDA